MHNILTRGLLPMVVGATLLAGCATKDAVQMAQATADAARMQAEQARSTADQAISSAQLAQQRADQANGSAQQAQQTANSAQTVANSAQSTAQNAASSAEQARADAIAAEQRAQQVEQAQQRPAAPGALNYIRIPAAFSLLLLLVWFPLILGLSSASYQRASGLSTSPYLWRWLAVTGAAFLISAVCYALRLRRAARRPGAIR